MALDAVHALARLAGRDDGVVHCQTESAADYYGLGVRLGIYFAWLTGWLANAVVPSEFGQASDTNTIFLLTLLISMANSSRIGILGQVDGLVLMHLCGGTVFGILSLWGYRTRMYYDKGPRAVRLFGGFGTHTRLIVSLAVSVFGLWFWIYGVTGSLKPMGPGDAVEPPNTEACSELFTFFFAKVPAAGGIRIYYIIVCASCIVYFGMMLIASFLASWIALDRVVELAGFKSWANTNRLKYATGFTHKELTYIFKFLRVANLLWLVFSAMTVEFTLNFNHIGGVLGGPHDAQLHFPSQLLPFLVGAFAFVRTCYKWIQDQHPVPSDDGDDDNNNNNHDSTSALQLTPVAPPSSGPFSPGPRGLTQRGTGITEIDDREVGRPWAVRYLVSWLPWIGLVQHSTKQSRLSTMIKKGTGFSDYSVAGGNGGGAMMEGAQAPRERVPSKTGREESTAMIESVGDR